MRSKRVGVNNWAYINQDPIGVSGGLNFYQYALGSPVNATDPLGLFVPLVVLGAMAALGMIIGGGVNAGKQKFIDKKCKIDWWDVGNSAAWGGIGGAAMPVLGTTMIGAAAIGGVTGFGSYTTGTTLNPASQSQWTVTGALANTAMGTLGGGIGGKFTAAGWGGGSSGVVDAGILFNRELSDRLTKQVTAETLTANAAPKAIGQGALGNLIGSTTEIPCLTCKPKCN